jgi:hypothetical protein
MLSLKFQHQRFPTTSTSKITQIIKIKKQRIDFHGRFITTMLVGLSQRGYATTLAPQSYMHLTHVGEG